MTNQVNPITETIKDFLAPALALATAGYIDDVMYLWAAYASRSAWVAGLSAEDRAEFLNFEDTFMNSIATTSLGTSNAVEHEEQEHLVTGDIWADEDYAFCSACGFNHAGKRCATKYCQCEHIPGGSASGALYDFDESDSFFVEVDDPRQDDHIQQVWGGQP